MTSYLVPILLGAVTVALVLGLLNMARGGSANRSQNLMRWRVGLQFAAIILLVIAMWWSGASR
jgi:NADH:ubiquinone oxidoreductase subunit H